MPVGKYHHGDGSWDLAVGLLEDDEVGFRVGVLPEPGGSYEVFHHVPEGTGDGHFEVPSPTGPDPEQ